MKNLLSQLKVYFFINASFDCLDEGMLFFLIVSIVFWIRTYHDLKS
jgi:hypothetical protein